MKKAIILSFAVMLLTVMCFCVTPARAVEVNFNGEWRVRGFAFDVNGEKDCDNTRTYWDQRFRLYITAKANDHLKGVVRMLTPNHNSDGGNETGSMWGGADGDNGVQPKPVLWDIAYLDFDVPMAQLNIKLGRQGLDLGNMIVLGSTKSYDAVVLGTTLENIKLSAFALKMYEGQTSDIAAAPNGSEDDENVYGFALNFNAAPNASVGIFGALLNDGDTDRGYIDLNPSPADYAIYPDLNAYWLGLTANVDYAPLKMKFEADYSNVKMNSVDPTERDCKTKGYALYGDVCADLSMAKVGFNVLYTTGDKQDDDEYKSEEFMPISSFFSERWDYDYLVMRTYLYANNGGDWSISNLTAFQLYAMKALTPKLDGKLSAQSYKFSKDPDGKGTMGTKLGYEVDAKLTYKLYDNLSIAGIAAYWFTNNDTFQTDLDSNGQLDDPDDCWLLKHEILYKF